MKTKLCLFGILLNILFISCSAEDGKDGINGQDGEQGPAGTANVMYSDWIDQDWNLDDVSTYKSMQIIEDYLTDDFLDNGGFVLGFFRFQDNVPYQLPYQNITSEYIRTVTPVIFSTYGEVRFTIQSTDGTALTDTEVYGSGSSNPQYKYVLIPGGVNISGKTSADYKNMSYKEICKLFHIPE